MGYDPTGHWDWGWEEQVATGISIFLIGLALLFVPPAGSVALAVGGIVISSTTVVATGGAMAITGTVIVGDALIQENISYAKQSKKSGKERATDKPSWVSQSDVDMSKSSQQNANDLLNNKYGIGNWPKGPGTEYNQIVKWIDRSLRAIAVFVIDMIVEDMHDTI